MSTQVFPTLVGLTFGVERTHKWSNTIMESVSGKETRVAYWNAASYTWTLNFEFLRSSTSFSEFQNLWGFVSARRGRYDSFLYQDYIDNTVTGSAIGTGDSTNRAFQLLRQFGGSSAVNEPVLAPNVVSRVTVAGSSVSSTTFSVGAWGSSLPGIVTFSTFAPSSAQAVAANFTYYFPVRFDADVTTFTQFMYNLWENPKIVLQSLK
jgi:uncharacterized protein (TIGR02217 family)